MKITKRLKSILDSDNLEYLLEAHNGLSAKIVEEAGFNGIWASGLAMSASLGVRDSNELSWTQILDLTEFIASAVDVPVLLDGDTGFGNFNNVRRLVCKLESRGVAGVCIEDKLFPKRNSFVEEVVQQLVDPDEFCGKLHAAMDTRQDDDFCIVARVEALTVGAGMNEALDRAERYAATGVDAVLIHSKKTNPSEIATFCERWQGAAPLVIVPTTYEPPPRETLEACGISVAIWANHMVRAGISAMQQVAQEIATDCGVQGVESGIAKVEEVFRLQNEKELRNAEKTYLPNA